MDVILEFISPSVTGTRWLAKTEPKSSATIPLTNRRTRLYPGDRQ